MTQQQFYFTDSLFTTINPKLRGIIDELRIEIAKNLGVKNKDGLSLRYVVDEALRDWCKKHGKSFDERPTIMREIEYVTPDPVTNESVGQ